MKTDQPLELTMNHKLSLTRRVFTTLALGMALAGPAQAQTQTVLKVGLSLPQGASGFDFVNGMYERFKSELEAGTQGSIKVDLVYGGALGNPNDRLSQVRRGTIQMSDAADGNYATVFPDIQVLSMPYLFDSEPTAWKVLDGPFGKKLGEDLRVKTGIRVLGFWESGGFKHFSSNKPIRSVADFSGQKLRAIGPLAVKTAEALGASASPIAFNELYTSLKTGVVDGQDNSVSVFRLVKLQEVQKHMLLSGHTYGVGVLGINDAFYGRLTPAERSAVDAAAAKALVFNRQASRQAEREALEALRSQGVTVTLADAATRKAIAQKVQVPVADWLKSQLSSTTLIDEAIAATR
jgi:tripartite ATP-independent transporter DctP family solute receptor